MSSSEVTSSFYPHPWSRVAPSEWNDWKWQLKNRIQTLEELSSLLKLSPEEEEGCRYSSSRLLFAITPHFFSLIDREDPNCPIRKQVVPRIAERYTAPEERSDPMNEDGQMPVPGIVHRYPDRVLFIVTNCCASYCRYCTRSRLVSNAQHYNFRPSYEKGLEYIRKTPAVRDVLISGGDPLLLANEQLEFLIKELRSIPHVEFIRIGTRVPIFLPQRITPALCSVFLANGPIWMSIHTNHPKECTKEMEEACKRLLTSHVVIGNQSVLLKGVNDNPTVIRTLNHRLLQCGVHPYYLHQCDLVAGTSHFRTHVKTGLEIIEQLRGYTSGYAVPQYIIDTPGGKGKVPMNPQTVIDITDKEYILRNFKGEECRYPL